MAGGSVVNGRWLGKHLPTGCPHPPTDSGWPVAWPVELSVIVKAQLGATTGNCTNIIAGATYPYISFHNVLHIAETVLPRKKLMRHRSTLSTGVMLLWRFANYQDKTRQTIRTGTTKVSDGLLYGLISPQVLWLHDYGRRLLFIFARCSTAAAPGESV